MKEYNVTCIEDCSRIWQPANVARGKEPLDEHYLPLTFSLKKVRDLPFLNAITTPKIFA
jgi:hypothetical protein